MQSVRGFSSKQTGGQGGQVAFGTKMGGSYHHVGVEQLHLADCAWQMRQDPLVLDVAQLLMKLLRCDNMVARKLF